MTIRSSAPLFLMLCVAGSVVLPAQSQKFVAERDRLFAAALDAQKAMGIKDPEGDPRLLKYPAATFQPVNVQKVLPGGSLSVALTGKIPPGVTVLSDRDGAVVAGAAVTGTSYSARVNVGPSEVPGFIKLHAYTPVSFYITNVPVAFIDAVYQFDLKSANGFTVKVIPAAKTFNIERTNATLSYRLEFFKPGETKPFETRGGTLRFNASDDPRLRLDIQLTELPSPAQAEYEALSQRVVDPKLTDAERRALAERQAKAQQRMMEEMMQAGKDPAAAQKKVDDFGCRILQVYPGEAGAVRANIACGRNFNGGNLQTTGTMTLVK
jgi:hypothetical protein